MIPVGQPIPMALQLSDGSETQYVRCLVLLPSGEQAASANLISRQLGLYSAAQVPMPDADFVNLQYRVYADPGYTVLNEEYGLAAETVIRKSVDQVIEVIGELTGALLEV